MPSAWQQLMGKPRPATHWHEVKFGQARAEMTGEAAAARPGSPVSGRLQEHRAPLSCRHVSSRALQL